MIDFELQFATTYPKFTKRLLENVGPLTQQEITVCMHIKMNIPNQKIQKNLGISQSTLANVRSSIRKKFELNRSQSLTNSKICI